MVSLGARRQHSVLSKAQEALKPVLAEAHVRQVTGFSWLMHRVHPAEVQGLAGCGTGS
jgi:hypothetical protein